MAFNTTPRLPCVRICVALLEFFCKNSGNLCQNSHLLARARSECIFNTNPDHQRHTNPLRAPPEVSTHDSVLNTDFKYIHRLKKKDISMEMNSILLSFIHNFFCVRWIFQQLVVLTASWGVLLFRDQLFKSYTTTVLVPRSVPCPITFIYI